MELWVFFWSAIVPLVEGVFLPLGSDPLILNAASASTSLKPISASTSRSKRPPNLGTGSTLPSSSTLNPNLLSHSSASTPSTTSTTSGNPTGPSTTFKSQPIDVRQHLLTMFLFAILKTMLPRVVSLLSPVEDETERTPPSQQQLARLQQMALIVREPLDFAPFHPTC